MGYVAIAILGGIVAVQWVIIWRLMDRLLVQSRIPSLGPVRTAPPDTPPEPRTPRKLFSVPVED